MFKKVETFSELKTIETIASMFVKDCVYFYINLHNYLDSYEADKFSDSNVCVYVDDDNTYPVYALMYFNTLHFFSEKEGKKDSIVQLIEMLQPQVVFASCNIGKILCDDLKMYASTEYKNYCLPIDCGIPSSNIQELSEKDIEDMVDFLLRDPEYIKSYSSREELVQQLTSRYKKKTGRYFAIKEQNKIIALEGTNGETEDIAITGSLLVDNNYRGRGLAREIVGGIRYILCHNEKKTVYGLVVNGSVVHILLDMGAECVSCIYKFNKKSFAEE